MKKIVLVLVTVALASVMAAAQSLLKPTADEQKDLQLAQKDAIIAQLTQKAAHDQADKADKDFSDAVAKLTDLGDAVKKAHSWPANTKFDLQSLTFLSPVAPVTPAAPKK